MTSVEAVMRVLEPNAVRPGAHTPSTAFGADFICHFARCDLEVG
jgi:hypothetical protein